MCIVCASEWEIVCFTLGTRTMQCRCNMVLYYFINGFCFAFVNVDILNFAHSSATVQLKTEETLFFLCVILFFFFVLFGFGNSIQPTFHLGIADFVRSFPISFTQSLQSVQQKNVRRQSSMDESNVVIKWARPPNSIQFIIAVASIRFFSEFIYRQTIKRMQTKYERV